MTYKRPESVLVVVYSKASEVLLLRRVEPADFWQSVTGSLEADETPARTAVRELTEETGFVGVTPIDCDHSNRFKIFPVFRYRYPPGVEYNTEHVFRLCVPTAHEIRLDNSEHHEYRWLPKRDAVDLVSSYTNRDAIIAWVPDK
ncbi:MAG: dihydroneopterin triphosphate diphosphatase [Gammaproteobacteria bacterium]